MLAIGPSQSIAGSATSATTVNCTITGCLTDGSVPPIAQSFKMLYQGQLANSVTALIANSASQEILISSIHLFNTGGTAQTVTLAINGTAGTNTIATITLPANGWATYEDKAGWTVYSSTGLVVTGSVLLSNGLGTPSSATTALTASTEILQGGTLFSLPTPAGPLVAGNRFRWYIGIEKTNAGTATWAVKVKFGINGTTADAAIASWTSNTNTAAVDQCLLIIECKILTLGATATAACIAFYSHDATSVTGLGRIDPVPTSTATFDTTAVGTQQMHVDITAGASAVMTGVGSAEQLA